MALLNALWMTVAAALVYGVPGWLAWRLLPGPRDPEEAFPTAAGLGVVGVHTLAVAAVGAAGLLGPAHLTAAGVVGASAALSAVLGVLAWRRGVLSAPRIRRPRGRLAALYGLTALAFAFFLLHFDWNQFAEESCILRAATFINVDYLDPGLLQVASGGVDTPYLQAAREIRQSDRNDFLLFNQGQRLGPGVLVAPAAALFGTFGYRLVYALPALMLPLLGFVLGRRLTGRAGAGWAAAVLLAFSPWALQSQNLDENFMANPFGTLALALLTAGTPAPGAAGVALALFLGIRPEGVLVLPAALAFLARDRRVPRGSVARLLGGMVLAGLPYLVLQGALWLLAGASFQGALGRPPADHRFLGMDLRLSVLLNWPFVDAPLRSPYNAFPTLAAFPLDTVRRLGIALAALVPGGAAWLWRRDRRAAWLLAGWFLPFAAMLMVQSNWVEPNKMGILATVLAPVVLAVVAGGVALLDRGGPLALPALPAWRRWAVPLAAAAVMGGGWLALRDWQAPVDDRVYRMLPDYLAKVFSDRMPTHVDEDPAYVAWDRRRMAPGVLPSAPWSLLAPDLLALRARQLGDALERPAVAQYDGPPQTFVIKLTLGTGYVVAPVSLYKVASGGAFPFHLAEPAPGATLRPLALDLSAPPVLADRPLVPCPDGATPVPVDGDVVHVFPGRPVPWSAAPTWLAAWRDRFGTVQLATYPGKPGPFDPPPWLQVRVHDGPLPGGAACLALPDGATVRLSDYRSYSPGRGLARWGTAGDAPWDAGAQPFMP